MDSSWDSAGEDYKDYDNWLRLTINGETLGIMRVDPESGQVTRIEDVIPDLAHYVDTARMA